MQCSKPYKCPQSDTALPLSNSDTIGRIEQKKSSEDAVSVQV